MGVPPIDIAVLGRTEVDALAVPLAQPLDSFPASLDKDLRERLSELAASDEFRGDRGEALLLHLDGVGPARRVVLAGLLLASGLPRTEVGSRGISDEEARWQTA